MLISLLFHAFSFPQEWEAWDETLVPWLRRQWSRRRYRRHTLAGRLAFLRRRGLVLLCRLGLMAVLLVWSGWLQCWSLSWALLSLPLADVLLSLLPLYWPGVLKVRAYPHLVRGAHHLYCLPWQHCSARGCRPRLSIWVPNFWLSARQVRERLLAEGHIASVEVSLQSIYEVARETGFAEVRRLLRQIFEFTADGPQWRDKVLLDRLFELNEILMARLQAGEGLTPQLMLEVETLKEAVGDAHHAAEEGLALQLLPATGALWPVGGDRQRLAALPSLWLFPDRPQEEHPALQEVSPP